MSPVRIVLLALGLLADEHLVAKSCVVSERVVGAYARERIGRLTMAGTRWRLDFATSPSDVTYVTAVIGEEDGGEGIGLNAERRTWFMVDGEKYTHVDRSLFSFGNDVVLGKLQIERTRERGPRIPGSPDLVIEFRYRFTSRYGGARLRGRVWGEVRVWAGGRNEPNLSWSPVSIDTGLEQFDRRLREALADGKLHVSRSEVEVSRALDGGVVLHQVTYREWSQVERSLVSSSTFAVPGDYRYEPPIIAAPNAP